jgi:hypothetical protein
MSSTPEQNGEVLDQLVSVCRLLSDFIDKGTWTPANALEELVLGTLARGRGTYETIVDLVKKDRTLQAAMLGRSLFEDMAVTHWLVLHQAEPDWLIHKFTEHRNAMRLHDATMRTQAKWMPSGDDISDLTGREDELRREFGRYAEYDWWGRDRDGTRVTMPRLVERLAATERFQPRLQGEEPILEQYYAFQHKAWTQALHHTAAGMHMRPDEQGGFPLAVALPSPFLILFSNYWVFGQLIFVALELGAPIVLARFEKLFLAGLAIFGEAIGIQTPWAGELERWAQE